MKSKELDWGGDKDGEKRGTAFCIVCAWFLRLLMRGTERHQHQLPGFCLPTQTPVPLCLPETLLSTPPVRRHLGGWWEMAPQGRPKAPFGSVGFYQFQKRKPNHLFLQVRSERINVFLMSSRWKSGWCEAGHGRRALEGFPMDNLEQGWGHRELCDSCSPHLCKSCCTGLHREQLLWALKPSP